MKCKNCGHLESRVLNSRDTTDNTIKRRRECIECGYRFTTFETIEDIGVLVIKSNGTRQLFDPLKIKNSLIKASEKTKISMVQINDIVNEIERVVLSKPEQEITSKLIGELVMNHLKKTDEVAYVRFAAVYRKFTDIDTFVNFINDYKDNNKL